MKKPRSFTPLSSVQVKALCALASKAYRVAKARGSIDYSLGGEDFRRAGQLEAAGVESLKKATQEHYLSIKGKWFTVLGNLEEAFYCFLNSSAEHEATRQMRWRLMGQVALLAEGIQQARVRDGFPALPDSEAAGQAWAYTASLARDKFSKRLDDLDADQLEQLGFTVVNRANAKRGRGNPSNRNKSQRLSKAAPDVSLNERADTSLMTRATARLAPNWQRR